MTPFDYLPSVKTCCFLVNLIDGCYFAAIYGIFSILDFTFGLLSNESDTCWGERSTIPDVIEIYGYFMIIVCCYVGIISVIYIWGLRKDKSYTAVWFMYAMTFKALCICVFTGLVFYGNQKFLYHETPDPVMNCEFPYFIIGAAILFVFVHLYLVLIVRSYHIIMVKKEAEAAHRLATVPANPQPRKESPSPPPPPPRTDNQLRGHSRTDNQLRGHSRTDTQAHRNSTSRTDNQPPRPDSPKKTIMKHTSSHH